MGFGFVVARFGLFLREMALMHPTPTPHTGGLSVWFGSCLVLLGVAVNLVAAMRHVTRLRAWERGGLIRPRPLFGAIVAVLLALVGLGMATYLVVFARE